jgi:Arc/MetJ-type ribon-helix-helix transcriptional regulator
MDDAGRIELPADALAIAERLVAEGLYENVTAAAVAGLRALDPFDDGEAWDGEFDPELLEELERRSAAIDRGEVQLISLEDVKARLAARRSARG